MPTQKIIYFTSPITSFSIYRDSKWSSMYVSINESSGKFYEQNQKSKNTDYDLHFTHIIKYFFHNGGPLLQTHSQVVCLPSSIKY